jgi:hypothetical protein
MNSPIWSYRPSFGSFRLTASTGCAETGTVSVPRATSSSRLKPISVVARRRGVVRSVEVDEEDRTGPARVVDDARLQAARDEREVRIRVRRLHGALLRRQFVPLLQFVVGVAGAFREHRSEQLEVRREAVVLGRQPGRQRLGQVPGRRVRRHVEALRVVLERVTVEF